MDEAIYIKTEKGYGTEEGKKIKSESSVQKGHLKLAIYKGGQKTGKRKKKEEKEEIPWKSPAGAL